MSAGVAQEIAAAVLQRAPVHGIRLIGVDGPSGSGKSFLAAGVAAALSAPIVEIDDFVSWGEVTGWWPRFDEQVLRPLLAGADAVYQARDWSDWYGSSLGVWKTQPWAPIVVFEGVSCTRRDTEGLLAYAVWVEAPAAMRIARGLARDTTFEGKEELWRRWMAEEDAFFTADGTRERADRIVDTSPFG